MLKKLSVSFVATMIAAAFAGSAQAQATLHLCQMSNEGQRGFISSQIAIAVPDQGRVAVISDAITQTHADGPVQGWIADQRNRVTWSVKARSRGGRLLNIRYRADLARDGRTVRVNASIERQRQTAQGRCETRRQG